MNLSGTALIGLLAVLAAAPRVSADGPSPTVSSASTDTTAPPVCQPTADGSWVDIISSHGAVGIQKISDAVTLCSDVKLSADTRELTASPGSGVAACLAKRRSGGASNLISSESFGDCELCLEFLIGEKSNSGVKLQERYEIQLYDSQGCAAPTAKDCGGVYPHWVYRADGKGLDYIDDGVPPLTNAAQPAGEWQALHVIFRAPRFDKSGNKTLNARLELVELNGAVVQRNIELESPTGNATDPLDEQAVAPLMLQMDHGPVAFRNVRVRRL